MKRILELFQGSNLRARALRSSAVTVGGFGASQVIRLASNLILTRILFPEAFGMMALVMVFLQGLAMFSDVGVGPAIMQSKRWLVCKSILTFSLGLLSLLRPRCSKTAILKIIDSRRTDSRISSG